MFLHILKLIGAMILSAFITAQTWLIWDSGISIKWIASSEPLKSVKQYFGATVLTTGIVLFFASWGIPILIVLQCIRTKKYVAYVLPALCGGVLIPLVLGFEKWEVFVIGLVNAVLYASIFWFIAIREGKSKPKTAQ